MVGTVRSNRKLLFEINIFHENFRTKAQVDVLGRNRPLFIVRKLAFVSQNESLKWLVQTL